MTYSGANSSISDIARVLADARATLGLSQADLANRAGTTQAAVSRFENGRLNPQLSTILDLVRAVDLELRLIPREALPAVDAIIAVNTNPTAADPNEPLYALHPGTDNNPLARRHQP